MPFTDIIDASSIYLKQDAMKIAAAEAIKAFESDPSSVSVDRDLVQRHATLANKLGLPIFLQQLANDLSPITLQPLSSEDAATVKTALPGATILWNELVAGAPIVLGPEFEPSDTYLTYPTPSRADQLAFERLNRSYQTAGRSTILPLELFLKLCTDSDIVHNSLARSIALKADAPKGRLTVDASREGLNFEDKKGILAAKWGDIIYPTIADYCQLVVDFRNHFCEPVHLFKMDKEAWYRRIRLSPTIMPLLSFSIHLDNIPHIVIPTAQQFGVQ